MFFFRSKIEIKTII